MLCLFGLLATASALHMVRTRAPRPPETALYALRPSRVRRRTQQKSRLRLTDILTCVACTRPAPAGCLARVPSMEYCMRM